MQTFNIEQAIRDAGGDTVVGAAIGKSSATVARWRTRASFPSPDDQPALARALGVPLAELAEAVAVAAEAARVRA